MPDISLLPKKPRERAPGLTSQASCSVASTTLSWNNINVYLNVPKRSILNRSWGKTEETQRRQILKNVSGKVRPGQLLAIMGASGAGKTTFLNVLTNRNKGQLEVHGEVKINGHIVEERMNTRLWSYVQQDDLFIETLTVKEHLIFQASLRMDRHITPEERIKKVEHVISELGLTKCENTEIGNPAGEKSISGGERKRLAFASEVLTNSAIMLCDEPTTGLDSFMALSVVSVLKKLASSGRTIVCTIHQPSSEVYAMFSHLLLMAEGRVAYMGPAQGAVKFFKCIGLPVPPNHNPPDHFVRCLSVVPGKEEMCRKNVEHLCDVFSKSKEERYDTLYSLARAPPTAHSWKSSSKYKASLFQQTKVLLWRSFLTVARDKGRLRMHLLQNFAIAFIFGALFGRQNLDQKGINGINGALFGMLLRLSFSQTIAVMNTFSSELPVFLREHENGMYGTVVYFLCKTFAELPVLAVSSALFASYIYWIVGFNENINNFLNCLTAVILVSTAAASFGYMISCICGDINVALGVASPIMFMMVLFGGFFLNVSSLPIWTSWMKNVSWLYYGHQFVVINQWNNVFNITCTAIEEESGICRSSGKDIIAQLGFEEGVFYDQLLMIVILIVVYRTVGIFALLWKSHEKR